MGKRTRPWSSGLLAGLLLLATPGLCQETAPSIGREEVKRLISKGLKELSVERLEEARKLLESAWKTSDSQSAEAALGLAETYALLRQPKAAEEHARIAVELADHPWTKATALLVSGATHSRTQDLPESGLESPVRPQVRRSPWRMKRRSTSS